MLGSHAIILQVYILNKNTMSEWAVKTAAVIIERFYFRCMWSGLSFIEPCIIKYNISDISQVLHVNIKTLCMGRIITFNMMALHAHTLTGISI